ncbi:hypothetical protein F511_37981 [Dorcoceras hygrometricum]|uniref:Uncharacterized protein n=1 Tax=Dorcoceras hygrometricum TaxID=472368 RepID=A0A2Z7AD13_9LAMI|nr:hypothetical protein F511_37981 [Dorcoceras hygrometricum]
MRRSYSVLSIRIPTDWVFRSVVLSSAWLRPIPRGNWHFNGRMAGSTPNPVHDQNLNSFAGIQLTVGLTTLVTPKTHFRTYPSIMVSVQYGPFNSNIPIRSITIGNPGFTAGRGFNPAGGAPGGG